MIPMYVKDIRQSLQNKCYFAALSLALTLPDICGAAEFPNESVTKRYIEWYDKYIGINEKHSEGDPDENNPWLSGEIVYNLRNVFLHTGSPNIIRSKVKEERNQIDRFVLMLGDGSIIWESSINIEIGRDNNLGVRIISVNVTYLCNCLCDTALAYYESYKKDFKFDFHVMYEEDLLIPMNHEQESAASQSLIALMNKKLESSDSELHINEDQSAFENMTNKLLMLSEETENGDRISLDLSRTENGR